MKPLIDHTNRFRNSLRFKLIVGAVLVELVMLALMIGNNLRQSNLHLAELTRARTVEMAETFSIALAPPLAAQDYATMRSLLDHLVDLPDVDYLVVWGPDGRTMATSGPIPVPLPAPNPDALGTHASTLHAQTNLELYGQVYGRLQYGLSLKALRDAESSLLHQGLAIALAEIILSVLALSSMTILLTRRLESLTRASVRLAAGDFNTEVGVKGNDEVAALSAAFNIMSVAVREQFKRLDDSALVLRRSNAELTRMAEVMAHHLQEPLRRVVSYSQLLERRLRDHLGEDEKIFIGYTVAGALRMKRLLSDLQAYMAVDLDPLAGGRVVELSRCVERATDEQRQKIVDSGSTIESGPLPQVRGDATALTAVFSHLLDNAIEHRPAGHAVHIAITASRTDGSHLVIVRDDGSGIPEAYRKQVFGLFERLNVEEPGTGIGLAMVRKIVECHGGHTWIEDNPPTGTALCFTLPAVDGEDEGKTT